MRKPAFCICEKKDADQLRGNREADQRLCFRYTDNTIPLLSKSEISSLSPSSVAVQSGLCQTWSETPKTGFLRTRLNSVAFNRALGYYIQIWKSVSEKLRTHSYQTLSLLTGLRGDMSRIVRKPFFLA